MKTKLCDIADIRAGHPFRGTITPIAHAETHVVQVRDVDDYGEINSEQLITTELLGRKHPDYLQTGDILFVAKGARHFATYVEQLPEHCVCSPHFFIVRVHQQHMTKVLPEFISWQLNQLPAQRYFQTNAEGSLYVSIRRQVLEDTPITLPPMATQQRLVALHRAAVREHKVLQQLIESRQQQLDMIASELFSE